MYKARHVGVPTRTRTVPVCSLIIFFMSRGGCRSEGVPAALNDSGHDARILLRSFERDGYVVVDDILSPNQLAEVRTTGEVH